MVRNEAGVIDWSPSMIRMSRFSSMALKSATLARGQGDAELGQSTCEHLGLQLGAGKQERAAETEVLYQTRAGHEASRSNGLIETSPNREELPIR